MFRHRLLRGGNVTTKVAIANVNEDVGRELGVLGANTGGTLGERMSATSSKGTVQPVGRTTRTSLAIARALERRSRGYLMATV